MLGKQVMRASVQMYGVSDSNSDSDFLLRILRREIFEMDASDGPCNPVSEEPISLWPLAAMRNIGF